MNTNLLQVAKDVVVPLLVALLPFAPSVYERLTEPTLHFVYEVKNERNPVNEWNRQLTHFFKSVDVQNIKATDSLPAPLLKRIGAEIYKSLPAMISGIGFHPADSSRVSILNAGTQELRNIRVHFSGCEGFDTYETWPDSLGSANNPAKNGSKISGQITLRYDKLPPSVSQTTTSMAQLSFYGESTSKCTPTVEAELPNGSPAIGKREALQDYVNNAAWERHDKQQRVDFFFKLFLSLAVLYLFLQVRSVKQRKQP